MKLTPRKIFVLSNFHFCFFKSSFLFFQIFIFVLSNLHFYSFKFSFLFFQIFIFVLSNLHFCSFKFSFLFFQIFIFVLSNLYFCSFKSSFLFFQIFCSFKSSFLFFQIFIFVLSICCIYEPEFDIDTIISLLFYPMLHHKFRIHIIFIIYQVQRECNKQTVLDFIHHSCNLQNPYILEHAYSFLIVNDVILQ